MIRVIWASSGSEGINFINSNNLNVHFIQFLKDDGMKHGYWMIFRDIPEAQMATLMKLIPKPSVI